MYGDTQNTGATRSQCSLNISTFRVSYKAMTMRPADARAFSLPNSRKGPGVEVDNNYATLVDFKSACPKFATLSGIIGLS